MNRKRFTSCLPYHRDLPGGENHTKPVHRPAASGDNQSGACMEMRRLGVDQKTCSSWAGSYRHVTQRPTNQTGDRETLWEGVKTDKPQPDQIKTVGSEMNTETVDSEVKLGKTGARRHPVVTTPAHPITMRLRQSPVRRFGSSHLLQAMQSQSSMDDKLMFSQIAEITSCLFLSSASAVRGENIRSLGITHVINVTMEIPNLQLPHLETTQIHVDDTPTARLGLYFDRCADKIHQVGRKGGKTLVHCVAGVSRSATICLAYLVKYQQMTLEQAYRHVKKRRLCIHPNAGFWRQLIDYEKRLLGHNSVKMVTSSIGWIPDVYQEETKNMVWLGKKTSR